VKTHSKTEGTPWTAIFVARQHLARAQAKHEQLFRLQARGIISDGTVTFSEATLLYFEARRDYQRTLRRWSEFLSNKPGSQRSDSR
jgi:hypothetical protein